ncbi:hypothetical protein C8R11_103284 [Nitrosomonas aestuarii]|nr:hypothetical protein C8R11_103284 [Nitrosomonas aestuarii]
MQIPDQMTCSRCIWRHLKNALLQYVRHLLKIELFDFHRQHKIHSRQHEQIKYSLSSSQHKLLTGRKRQPFLRCGIQVMDFSASIRKNSETTIWIILEQSSGEIYEDVTAYALYAYIAARDLLSILPMQPTPRTQRDKIKS